jgi:hypothetical protein
MIHFRCLVGATAVVAQVKDQVGCVYAVFDRVKKHLRLLQIRRHGRKMLDLQILYSGRKRLETERLNIRGQIYMIGLANGFAVYLIRKGNIKIGVDQATVQELFNRVQQQVFAFWMGVNRSEVIGLRFLQPSRNLSIGPNWGVGVKNHPQVAFFTVFEKTNRIGVTIMVQALDFVQ